MSTFVGEYISHKFLCFSSVGQSRLLVPVHFSVSALDLLNIWVERTSLRFDYIDHLGNARLSDLLFPTSLVVISDYAFSSCESLRIVNMPT